MKNIFIWLTNQTILIILIAPYWSTATNCSFRLILPEHGSGMKFGVWQLTALLCQTNWTTANLIQHNTKQHCKHGHADSVAIWISNHPPRSETHCHETTVYSLKWNSWLTLTHACGIEKTMLAYLKYFYQSFVVHWGVLYQWNCHL